MSSLGTQAAAVIGLIDRDLRIFVSYRARTLTIVLNLFFSLTLFFYLSRLVKVAAFSSPDQYYAFAVVGLVILQVLQSVVGTPLFVRQELVAGTFERLLVSPFGPVASVAGMLVYPFLFSLCTGLLMLVFGAVVFGLPVHWATAWQAVPIATLGTLAFAAFGLLFAAATIAFKQATGTQWIIAGISLVAGLYFPVTLLPHWIQWASDVQPFTPTVDLLRHALIGFKVPDPLGLDLLRIAGFAVLLLPLSVWVLGVAVRYGQRRGTIVEY